jgi:adenine-specific DNA glycosylase
VELEVLVAVWEGKDEATEPDFDVNGRPFPSASSQHLLFQKRLDSGLLAGMWAFPEVEAPQTVSSLATRLGLNPVGDSVPLPGITHVFTHLKARYRPVLVNVSETAPVERGRWVSEAGLKELPLPVAQRKMASQALSRLSPPGLDD